MSQKFQFRFYKCLGNIRYKCHRLRWIQQNTRQSYATRNTLLPCCLLRRSDTATFSPHRRVQFFSLPHRLLIRCDMLRLFQQIPQLIQSF